MGVITGIIFSFLASLPVARMISAALYVLGAVAGAGARVETSALELLRFQTSTIFRMSPPPEVWGTVSDDYPIEVLHLVSAAMLLAIPRFVWWERTERGLLGTVGSILRPWTLASRVAGHVFMLIRVWLIMACFYTIMHQLSKDNTGFLAAAETVSSSKLL